MLDDGPAWWSQGMCTVNPSAHLDALDGAEDGCDQPGNGQQPSTTDVNAPTGCAKDRQQVLRTCQAVARVAWVNVLLCLHMCL